MKRMSDIVEGDAYIYVEHFPELAPIHVKAGVTITGMPAMTIHHGCRVAEKLRGNMVRIAVPYKTWDMDMNSHPWADVFLNECGKKVVTKEDNKVVPIGSIQPTSQSLNTVKDR